ncbi:hypothetical protein OIU79_029002 [Salix purpurea]|uniref:DM2 domain-containing protein n=1 Tax=Salix purpurea TaxID=77065 RepID=A0A9Q0VZV5_SALPP|nr:hypothetical protein OIU79_029002 [Salix purpurea]
MVTDQEIAKGVETVLRQSDPSTVTSLNGIVQQLEAKLGINNFTLPILPCTLTTTLSSILSSSTQQQHQVFPQDLNFRQPQAVAAPPAPPPKVQAQQQQQRQTQHVQNVGAAPHEVAKESSTPVGSKRRGGPGGLNKVCGVSPELQAVVGEPALPRTEIVKQLWHYIRKNNLQDPSNKRKIICDDALRVVFETDCTDMFKMNKLLAKHIIPLQPSKESGQAKRAKVDAETPTENKEPAAPLVVISEGLAEFLGATEREMTQTEALRRVWEYIKLKQLEDPLNSMVIQCDTKLHDLLGCESISAVGVGEVLARHHLFKRS